MYIEKWINSEKHNKKVLITNNMKNAVRAIRKCNDSGFEVFNTECKSIRDIVFEVIAESIASEGKTEYVNIIDNEMCGLILNEIIIKNICELSFINPKSISLATADEVLRIINKIRLNSITKAFENSNDRKIAEIKKLICLYEKRLSDENKYDYCSGLKKAISVLEKKGNKNKNKTRYGLFKSHNYTRLEMEFISKLTGGNCPFITYTEKTTIKCKLFKSYGIENEINYVADKICEQKMPFGSVNLFYTSDEYESFIKGILGNSKIPVRFIKEYSALDTNIVSFMYSVIKWAYNDFLYSDIEQIVLNPVFEAEGLFDAGGMLRSFISNGLIWGLDRYKAFVDKKRAEKEERDNLNENQIKRINSFLNFICDMTDIFEGYENISKLYDKLYDFTMKYTRSRNSEKMSTINALKNEKELFREIKESYDMKEAVRTIKGRIESMKIKDEESTDAVNAIKLNDCEIIERKYNFVIGLSARQFNSNVTESPVMTDSEIIKYIRGNRQLAVNVNRRKERALMDTLRSSAEGTEIYAGYIYYDTVNAIMTSPANVFIKLAGDESNIETVENKGIINKNIITESSDKVWGKFESADEEGESKKSDENIKTVLSATKVKELLECPLKYFYKNVENLVDKEFIERNSGIWLDPLGKGNLTHAVLERYVKKELMNNSNVSADVNDELFDEIYESVVEEYKEKYQYDTEKIFLREKEEIRKVIYGYIKKLHNEMGSGEWMVAGCEEGFENVEYRAESWSEDEAIVFKGTIDRIDVNKDNRIRITDYKSGQETKKTYKQHVIYPMAKAYADEFVYDYMFIDDKVKYNKENMQGFSDDENETLKNVITDKKYEVKEPDCRYCNFKTICREKMGDRK